MDYLSDAWERHSHSTAVIVATTAVATTAIITILRHALYPTWRQKTFPSPLQTTLPKLGDEASKLDYKPDAFPGARDVPTPYGSMRVYEFGPETGRKALFIHGISTSCQTLTYLARGLAESGHRVMLFDLWGRGFSDGVGDLPHDARLYASQALLALASSPLPWTGAAGFDLVGYSMGGGVAVHLAAALPATVRSLVLLAPAGMIREVSFGAVARFVFQSGYVPDRLLSAVTRRRLRKPIASSVRKNRGIVEAEEDALAGAVLDAKTAEAVELAAAELSHQDGDGNNGDGAEADPTPLNARVMRYVHWMIDNHAGFVPAFLSCVRHAPLFGQQDVYSALAERPARSVCVVLGRRDEVVHPEDFEADALPLMGGREKVPDVTVVGGGHDFPMTHSKETLKAMQQFWGEGGG
ncbi:uncharacterized protein E0L32_009644 [Thyridium curvatum]|uniref:Serine aminopeptidase S33 domain-containing protein n=1 Tax=Thyridium curvatum TaxID=1093900 RepID=A0A507AXC4_9PEZI|nr:uncharacterized protein E0L32_009644 [Thyridium curvatum]TPX08940.1 hypothetical protein E0L32_009644 [Thyridium curvatum]